MRSETLLLWKLSRDKTKKTGFDDLTTSEFLILARRPSSGVPTSSGAGVSGRGFTCSPEPDRRTTVVLWVCSRSAKFYLQAGLVLVLVLVRTQNQHTSM